MIVVFQVFSLLRCSVCKILEQRFG